MGTQFDDGKEEGALRTIGEVAKALDIKPHVLRYWEQQFPMLDPLKRSGGRRYYRPEDVELVERIDRLVNSEGYTLKGAKKALSGKAMATEPNTSRGETAVSKSSPAVEPADPNTPASAPQDAGGVDAFFGSPQPGSENGEAAHAVEQKDEPKETPASTPEGAVPVDVLAQLKAIRQKLATAIEA